MTRRPRSHEIEDLSRTRLRQAFNSSGWTVEDLGHDYGEDCLVRIFERGLATPFAFFVQAKATDRIDKYMHKDQRNLVFPIKTDHLRHWGKLWQPVVLAVFETWDGALDTYIQK